MPKNCWNYRVCTFDFKYNDEVLKKIGIFEVYYDENGETFMRSNEPILSWFIEKCEGPHTVEQACKEAAWDVKSMLKAFRVPTLDSVKDF